VLGLVEGLTEFLPVSSTGHQIIAADLLGFAGARAQAFNIIIQLGAVLAVVWEYRARIVALLLGLPREPAAQRFTASLLLAFLPAAVAGVLLSSLSSGSSVSVTPSV
jgi:undecaprenyl-diphosphatase